MLAKSYYLARTSSSDICSGDKIILLPSLSIISISYLSSISPKLWHAGLECKIALYRLLKLDVIDYLEFREAVSIFFAPG